MKKELSKPQAYYADYCKIIAYAGENCGANCGCGCGSSCGSDCGSSCSS